jgi:hypothetical protein
MSELKKLPLEELNIPADHHLLSIARAQARDGVLCRRRGDMPRHTFESESTITA